MAEKETTRKRIYTVAQEFPMIDEDTKRKFLAIKEDCRYHFYNCYTSMKIMYCGSIPNKDENSHGISTYNADICYIGEFKNFTPYGNGKVLVFGLEETKKGVKIVID